MVKLRAQTHTQPEKKATKPKKMREDKLRIKLTYDELYSTFFPFMSFALAVSFSSTFAVSSYIDAMNAVLVWHCLGASLKKKNHLAINCFFFLSPALALAKGKWLSE